MTARQFYDWQTESGAGDVLKLVEVLEQIETSWCMIEGLAVNHWAKEPMSTADVDIVIASNHIDKTLELLQKNGFSLKKYKWSINLTGHSTVSIQISTEKFYHDFPKRSVPADVHGILMRVALVEDTLKGKLQAYSDSQRRPSKRQKDLADIARLIETHPHLNEILPETVKNKLET